MAERQPTAKDLRALSTADLTTQLEKLRQELWQHRIKTKEGAQQQMHLAPAIKRQIARVHTVLREQRNHTQGVIPQMMK